jgi:hypothetical protein
MGSPEEYLEAHFKDFGDNVIPVSDRLGSLPVSGALPGYD